MAIKKKIKNIKKMHNKVKNAYNNFDLLSLQEGNYRYMNEYFAVLLSINASFLSVVFAISIYIILTVYFPYGVPYYLNVFPITWVVLSIANIVLLEKYVRQKSKRIIKYLLCISLLNIMTANGFIITGLLMLISTYMLYEINEKEKKG